MDNKPNSLKMDCINAFGVISAISAISLLPSGPIPVGNNWVGILLWLGVTALLVFLAYKSLTYAD